MKEDNIVAAIDIGTSNVIAALASISKEGNIIPIAFAEMPSKGVKKGGIVNIPLVQHVVSDVLDVLEYDGSYHIYSIVASISGISILGYNYYGNVTIRGDSITEHNVQQSISKARDALPIEKNRLLHILRQDFSIGNQTGIENPIGIISDSLTARVHIISSSKMAYSNVSQAFSHLDINVDRLIASSYASSAAVTTDDEKQLGVCVLDIGGGTTDISVIHQGSIKHTAVIPIGGNLITNDVAFFMRIKNTTAEEIKKKFDISVNYKRDDFIIVKGLSGVSDKFMKSKINNVIVQRYIELLEMVKKSLCQAGVENSFPGGFVICGGVAEQPGLADFIREVTKIPVRCAKIEVIPNDKIKESGRFATIMGLFICAYKEDYTITMTDNQKAGIINRLRDFLSILSSKF